MIDEIIGQPLMDEPCRPGGIVGVVEIGEEAGAMGIMGHAHLLLAKSRQDDYATDQVALFKPVAER